MLIIRGIASVLIKGNIKIIKKKTSIMETYCIFARNKQRKK